MKNKNHTIIEINISLVMIRKDQVKNITKINTPKIGIDLIVVDILIKIKAIMVINVTFNFLISSYLDKNNDYL